MKRPEAPRLAGSSLLAAALLSACTSAPLHHHTLVPFGLATLPAQERAATALGFILDPVSVPRQADIPQLLLRDAGGGVHLAEHHRWTAPLGEEIRTALSLQLQARLHATDFSRLGADPATRVYRIRTDVQRFESTPSVETRFTASWTLAQPSAPAARLSCRFEFAARAGAQAADSVQAYRDAVQGLAEQIASTLENVERAGTAATCAVTDRP